MYSLDQVIYFLEERQQTEDWNIRDAAIAYLRGYREILPEYAQMKLEAWKAVEDNPPLTWSELLQMKGKPVWICFGNECDNHDLWGGVWRIICAFTGRNDELACMITLEKYPDSFWKKSMGKTWQAYRKER